MAVEQTLAVLRVSYPVIQQVPVHPVHAGITRVAPVARLPVLETV